MGSQSWQDLVSEFERLRERDNDRLHVEYCCRNVTRYQWDLRGSDDATREDFIALAERAARMAECGTTWRDWLELLRMQEGIFIPSVGEKLYGWMDEPQETRVRKVRRSKAECLYSQFSELPKKERAKAVRKQMKELPSIPGPEGHILRVCQKSAIYCRRRAYLTEETSAGSRSAVERENQIGPWREDFNSEIISRVEIVKRVMWNPKHFKDHDKVLVLAEKLDANNIPMIAFRSRSRKDAVLLASPPKTYSEVAGNPKHKFYKRIFGSQKGALVKDLYRK